MNKAANKMAKQIAAELYDIDRKPPVEQMATYFDVGEKIACMVEDAEKYGIDAVADVVSLVPQLRNKGFAYGIMNLSRCGNEVSEFMLKETAVPMDNGKHLTLGHWFWLIRHQPGETEAEQDAWLGRELSWLRKESPSVEVLEHVEAILKAEYQRDMEEIRESAREAIGVLEMI